MNRPKENGPSAAPNTEPINTGVTDAVNEYDRVASIQIDSRLRSDPAVSVCPVVMPYPSSAIMTSMPQRSKGQTVQHHISLGILHSTTSTRYNPSAMRSIYYVRPNWPPRSHRL